MTDEFFDANRAIAEAQKCGRMLTEQTGSRSTWCIVTRNGFWASYFYPGDEDLLRRKLHNGHEILLVFAATRRQALARCSGYQAVDPSEDEKLRRFARQAMRRAA